MTVQTQANNGWRAIFILSLSLCLSVSRVRCIAFGRHDTLCFTYWMHTHTKMQMFACQFFQLSCAHSYIRDEI